MKRVYWVVDDIFVDFELVFIFLVLFYIVWSMGYVNSRWIRMDDCVMILEFEI